MLRKMLEVDVNSSRKHACSQVFQQFMVKDIRCGVNRVVSVLILQSSCQCIVAYVNDFPDSCHFRFVRVVPAQQEKCQVS